MQPRTPQEDGNWKFALESIGNRIWSNTDMCFAMIFGGAIGFCLGLIIWMIVKYT